MKIIKIIIVAIIVAALGFAIYEIVKPSEGLDSGEIEIPDGCDPAVMHEKNKYIDSVFSCVPFDRFDSLQASRHRLEKTYNDIMKYEDQKCQETVQLMILNAQKKRFEEMAEHEFADAKWPHWQTIKKMNDALLADYKQYKSSFNENNLSAIEENLNKIKATCDEYGIVLSYYNRVIGQSKKRANTMDDRWNYDYTRQLIGSRPSASAPVNHTDAYNNSNPDNVKRLLYDGNVAFLKSLKQLAENKVNENCDRNQYFIVYDKVSQEVEKFRNSAISLYNKNYSTVRSKANEMELSDFEKYCDK